MKTRFALALSLLSVLELAACGSRRLPPGTPPPEYEPPVVPAWAPEASDAGAVLPEGEPVSASDAGSATELSLDAGPR